VNFPALTSGALARMQTSFVRKHILRLFRESGSRGKASGGSRWIFASMATLPIPFAAHSKGPGLTEPLRLYVCGLQPRPSIQLSSSRVIATNNEYSRESRNPEPPLYLPLCTRGRRREGQFRFALAIASLDGMTTRSPLVARSKPRFTSGSIYQEFTRSHVSPQ
jgi:hypothetical protein